MGITVFGRVANLNLSIIDRPVTVDLFATLGGVSRAFRDGLGRDRGNIEVVSRKKLDEGLTELSEVKQIDNSFQEKVRGVQGSGVRISKCFFSNAARNLG